MYIPSNLMRQVLEVGASATARTKNIRMEDIWSELIQMNYENLERLRPEAIRAHFNFTIPKHESIDTRQVSTIAPVQVVGVDGSQIYPRGKPVEFAYVCAVACPGSEKPIYKSDFIDLNLLKSQDAARPDLK